METVKARNVYIPVETAVMLKDRVYYVVTTRPSVSMDYDLQRCKGFVYQYGNGLRTANYTMRRRTVYNFL